MKRLWLILFLLSSCFLFGQELNQEQENIYNRMKIRIATERELKSGLINANEKIDYKIYQGYEEITPEKLVLAFGDEEYYQIIKQKRIAISNNRKPLYFFIGGALLLLVQDEVGRVVDGSRDPGAYGMIPFCGIIGFIIDISKNKYQNVTDNWQLIWSNRELNNQIRNNASSNDKYNEIERLWNLKEKGIITEEEFLKKKKELLGE